MEAERARGQRASEPASGSDACGLRQHWQPTGTVGFSTRAAAVSSVNIHSVQPQWFI